MSDVRNINVRIDTNDGGTTYETDDIIDINIQRSITDGSVGIGFAQSDRLTFNVVAGDKLPKNTRVTVMVGIDDEEEERLGRFYVDECTRNGSAITVTAYDAMYLQDKKLVKFGGVASKGIAALTFPCTMQAMLDYIVAYRSLTCEFQCNNYTVDKKPQKPDESYFTVRELLGFIAACHGCNAKFNNRGRLVFQPFAESDAEITASDAVDITIDDSEPYQVTGLYFTVDSENAIYIDDSEEKEYDEDDIGIIRCYNPLATEAIAEDVWKDKVGKISYYGGSITQRGTGKNECGDVISVHNLKYPADTETYRMCITDISYSISAEGGFIETLSSQVIKEGGMSNGSPSGSSSTQHGVGEWLDPDHTTERFNDYNGNTSDNKYDHIEGYGNIVQSGSNFAAYGANHVEGMSNKVYGTSHNSYIGGFGNTFGVSTNMSTGVDMCMIHGNCNTLKSGSDSYVSGSQCTIDYASISMIIGDSLTLKYVTDSVVFGQSISATTNWAQIQMSIISGGRHSITNEVYCSIWSGLNNTGRANCGLAVGEDNEVNAIRSMTCGRGNKNTQSDSIMCGYYGTNGDWDYYRIAVGGGSGTSDRRNIFGVDNNGDVYGRSYNTMGADYAEYFEWADGNPENEDRCGMLVMLDGDKIVPAHGDDILGAVSAAPSVIGNSADLYWQGTYATDIYGRPVTNGKGGRMLSSAYDPGLKYIPRSERREWDAVGLVGRLVIRDNGSCTVGGYCTARNGMAQKTNTRTNVQMLRRINGTHIEVLIK